MRGWWYGWGDLTPCPLSSEERGCPVRRGVGAGLKELAADKPLSQPLPFEGRGARNGSQLAMVMTPPLLGGEGAGG